MNTQEIYSAIYLDDYDPAVNNQFKFHYIKDNIPNQISGTYFGLFVHGTTTHVTVKPMEKNSKEVVITNIIMIKPLWPRPTISSIAKSIDIHNKMQIWQKWIGEKVITVDVGERYVTVNTGILRDITIIDFNSLSNIVCFIDDKPVDTITFMIKFSDKHMISEMIEYEFNEWTRHLIHHEIKKLQ
jgi:hypothetical protein